MLTAQLCDVSPKANELKIGATPWHTTPNRTPVSDWPREGRVDKNHSCLAKGQRKKRPYMSTSSQSIQTKVKCHSRGIMSLSSFPLLHLDAAAHRAGGHNSGDASGQTTRDTAAEPERGEGQPFTSLKDLQAHV